MALELHQAGRVPRLVVAAVDVCSRPHPLKTFLYLDFMDRSKRENVWGKLLEEISEMIVLIKCWQKYIMNGGCKLYTVY